MGGGSFRVGQWLYRITVREQMSSVDVTRHLAKVGDSETTSLILRDTPCVSERKVDQSHGRVLHDHVLRSTIGTGDVDQLSDEVTLSLGAGLAPLSETVLPLVLGSGGSCVVVPTIFREDHVGGGVEFVWVSVGGCHIVTIHLLCLGVKVIVRAVIADGSILGQQPR